jgi:peptidoglycan L-alanyl-D-glutamate endopeptidase CwlK
MSLRLFEDDVLFAQRLLKAQGLYVGELDGIWGPLTGRAAGLFEQRTHAIRERMRGFDLRSERNITTLMLGVQRHARRFLARLHEAGLNARIISATRSYQAQNALYRRGRYGNPGAVVTNARGGRSFHNFGVAWDIALFADDGRYLTDEGPYERAAEIALVEGLEWGGHFRGFVDRPHYQLQLGLNVAQVRMRFEAGIPYTPAGVLRSDDDGAH